MDIDTLRQWIAERDSFSILETIDVHTGVRRVLHSWSPDNRTIAFVSYRLKNEG